MQNGRIFGDTWSVLCARLRPISVKKAKSGLDSLPGRERVAVHRLQAPFDQATTWLMWRKGMRGANLSAWIDLQQGETVAQATELAVSA
ncbi:hypothetical protein D3C81_773920 [compost metagenome]|jgi:hypothetical protein